MIIYVQFEFHQSVRKDIYLNKHERLSLFYFNFETFSQAIESSPMVFSGVPLSRSLVLCVEFLDHRLSFCHLYWLSFFDLWLPIVHLVSSNFFFIQT